MNCSRAALQQVTVAQVAAVASCMQSNSQNYSASMLDTVLFKPEKVYQCASGMVFPWHAKHDALNGFHSVHGGALATLADVFTRIHATSAVPENTVRSLSFEISFLSAVFENKECACVTRLVNQADNVIFTDFSFENEKTGEIYARGTHVLSVV